MPKQEAHWTGWIGDMGHHWLRRPTGLRSRGEKLKLAAKTKFNPLIVAVKLVRVGKYFTPSIFHLLPQMFSTYECRDLFTFYGVFSMLDVGFWAVAPLRHPRVRIVSGAG